MQTYVQLLDFVWIGRVVLCATARYNMGHQTDAANVSAMRKVLRKNAGLTKNQIWRKNEKLLHSLVGWVFIMIFQRHLAYPSRMGKDHMIQLMERRRWWWLWWNNGPLRSCHTLCHLWRIFFQCVVFFFLCVKATSNDDYVPHHWTRSDLVLHQLHRCKQNKKTTSCALDV